MPCLPLIVAVFFPRVVMIFIALLTHWFGAAFDTLLWPILGFLFMPYTTLAYMAAMLNNNHTVSGGWMALIIVAALVDVGGQGRSARRRKRLL
jgi:cell shape-determining protein MreD